ncbi:MAG TPA: peptidoglycan-binding domain-containing protein, partial [Tepidisphaeraceae bacterium]|nr:peptidoglycan-binding domain-containing protein [Tepidisphaeraceae bacterium]
MNLRAIFVAATCAIAITSAPALAQQGKAPIRQKPATAKPAPEKPDMLPTQVLLDRAGYSPGEIDGAGGRNTENAIAAFERDKKTKIADALAAGNSEPPTIKYVISAEDANTPFTPNIPEDMMEKSKLKKLDYASMIEMIGERFHASPALLKKLNPTATFAAGEEITVPNVQIVSDTEGKPVPNIIIKVSKSSSTLTVTDAGGATLMHAP